MAQMMRVYVAAPEGPMQVTLNPRVQPNPPPSPLFYPGNDEPIKLPQGIVSVLRLPYPFTTYQYEFYSSATALILQRAICVIHDFYGGFRYGNC